MNHNADRRIRLSNNSRFYIVAAALIGSVALLAALRLQNPSEELWLMRTQQAYGYISIGLLYLTLIISPIGSVVGRERIKKLAFSRRAIGVSAFYFAVLHVVIAFFGQLGGFSKLAYQPDIFKWSLGGGLIATIILFVMAITSHDTIIKWMTFPRWKMLHRLVYIAGVLLLLHVWTLGTHLAYGYVQILTYWALVVLLGLEAFRITRFLNRRYLKLARMEAGAVFITLWVIVSVGVLAVPTYLQNYHSRHMDHGDGDSMHMHGGHM